MKKSFAVIIGIIGSVIFSIGFVFKIIFTILNNRGSISVSVIGSADGPTSIFLAGTTGKTSTTQLIMLGFIILGFVLLLTSIILWIKRKK